MMDLRDKYCDTEVSGLQIFPLVRWYDRYDVHVIGTFKELFNPEHFWVT